MPTPITPSQITALMTGFRKEFQNGLGMAPSHYQQVATTVASTSKSNTYGWLGQFPAFREWVGSRSIQQMKVYGYAINNKTYEGTVAITRDDFEDDNLGVYTPLFQEMGRAAAAQPDELVFTALRDGNQTDCYDGKPFFDSGHPVYPKVDGSGDATKVANQFIEKTGTGAAQKDYDGAVWYLLDCSRALKPLIFQNRRPPELLALTNVDEGRAFTDNEFVFGASARRNVGYGFWQMAYRMQAPLTLDNLWKGWSAMRGFTADGGRKLGIRPTHLVVPVELEKTATQLLERELLAEGSTTVSNEMKGKLTLLVADLL